MIYVVLSFLMISLLLYVLLAGADFGAGIIELFSSRKGRDTTKKTIYRVIGPVWEANHIWIIIIVVILWVGFPEFYNVITVYLHIPLTLVLLGITLRGVSFVFRHYDAFKDKSQILYDWMFRLSSLITPIFLGMTFGSMISGEIILNPDETDTFYSIFIGPWLNWFSIFVGLFFASLCTFLASVLLIGESNKNEHQRYVLKARIANITVIVMGFLVLAFGYFNNLKFITNFIKSPYAIVLVGLSALLIFPLTHSIKKATRIKSRFLAGVQVVLILLAAIITHYPNLLITSDGTVNLVETASTPKVIQVLGISLIVGGAVILPGLFHLMKSFKMIKILEKL
ncbi:cytochrome d ubiquinol oxidase subunit II [Hyunsoonleella pacifica]|uniref:Cytochrome d ubiquinol oxidase subunit II n=1 Tax=Hyunsoonleella pacifica TaxID=1080224 RepID=A0A4Q9FS29_9FLAO|nr:cytochrome d ubiquinol oxidase subunit II [Hyunsoonleella pacifica]TBN18864.1 cytochrome d ubiquinol oxidase subunit II [Hyunsoonleella pacifica]GGD05422.1 cytochrome D ubiquinol oxidase subunit II [Hyunsoonleella pacifica]